MKEKSLSEENNFLEMTNNFEDYRDFSSLENIPSTYIYFAYRPYYEVTDEELTKIVQSSPSFDFLKMPDEDIYNLDDGSPL